MKLLSIWLMAAAFLTLLSGCATDDGPHNLTPRQEAETHGSFDPMHSGL
jgi:PBP1b-binding outer membrane lipoprotein LpoB